MKITPSQALHYALFFVFLAAVALDWSGHLDMHAENIIETMMAMLGISGAASHFGGKVTSAADVLARLSLLEKSIATDDGTAPPIPSAAPTPVPGAVNSKG